jgi:hypothetical protein
VSKFLAWLAASPLATAAKVGVAASLGYILMEPDTLGLPPIVVVGIVAAIPVLINWLNPADDRYGNGS